MEMKQLLMINDAAINISNISDKSENKDDNDQAKNVIVVIIVIPNIIISSF